MENNNIRIYRVGRETRVRVAETRLILPCARTMSDIRIRESRRRKGTMRLAGGCIVINEVAITYVAVISFGKFNATAVTSNNYRH